MKIIVLGLNHKTAPVEVREKLTIPETKLPEALKLLVEQTALKEAVIISTCNRTEIYGVLPREEKEPQGSIPEEIEKIKNFLSSYRQVARNEFEDNLYIYQEKECIEHLFEVAAGLDSMVVGEDQVLGQVKTAYSYAHQNRTTAKLLNILFQKALNLGKHVRTVTAINKGSVSVSSVAVELAEKIFGSLQERQVMIIGAGETSELTAKNLLDSGVKSILVSNRTFERAQELARKFNGLAVRFDEFPAYLEDVDIVISSTAAPHFILKKEDLLPLMRKRKHRALFLIDIAVPRDIDPQVNDLDNIYLYDIDDLEQIVKTNLGEREKEIAKCNQIIKKKTTETIATILKSDASDKKVSPES